ncbi:MAG: zinc transporter ZntB [Planctomycetota bacterium]
MTEAVEPLAAYVCDGHGRGVALGWDGVRAFRRAAGDERSFLWVHLHRTEEVHRRWLEQESGLDELRCETLLEEETRPRQVPGHDHLIVLLRGVNLNPGQEPDDMVSLRIYVGRDRVITLRSRRVRAVQDVRDQLEGGEGPTSPGDLLVAIAERIVDRQMPVVDSLEEVVDDVEENLLEVQGHELRSRIAEFRRTVIGLRRYLAPQRDVLNQLVFDRSAMLSEVERARLREIADRQTRVVEELDAARDRAAVANEELAGRAAERMNRNTYVLSIVAGVFLPLGLFTGLLGINVGGIPGTDSDMAFWVVCALLLLVAGVVLWLFRRLRML